ncbi:MAG: XRE family transcriptional regulator [Clostridia bacterium]|nr:XRE family transcriptional regulator [Clostridia bacterium]
MLDALVLAENIKRYRKQSSITQNELAERLFVSPQSVSKWECGISVPELSKLCEMANMFKVSIDTLIGNSRYTTTEKVFISIDGGGTKTEFVLFEESGSILKRLVLEGSNPTSCGISGTCRILKEGIDTLMSGYPNVAGIYAGISGASGGDPEKKIPKFLKETYPQQLTKCNSDVLNVVASTLDLENEVDKCVAVICGTGSVAFTYDGDKQERIGGWGYLLDNAGSGYDFGREALCAALAERDELGKKTLITPMVEAKIGGTVWDNISEIYSREKGYVASFASIVFDAYSRGDKVASEIIEKGADRLAQMINRAARNLPDDSLIVMAGGLMMYSEILINRIKSKVIKNLNFVVPVLPQIYGASVLCAKMCGIKNTTFREKFNSDYEKII